MLIQKAKIKKHYATEMDLTWNDKLKAHGIVYN